MKGIALGQSLLLIAAATNSSAAQNVVAVETAARIAACGESFGCLDTEAASGEQTRRPRVQPGEDRIAASPANPAEVMIRGERSEPPNASQPTWKEDPSLMDSSWRRWPSRTDF
jgi:hypothetical protein